MTASFRTIVGVLALSLLSVFARAEMPAGLDRVKPDTSSSKTEEKGKALRQDLLAKYENFKARQKGIFNENISELVAKYLIKTQALVETEAILEAAGFDKLQQSRVQNEAVGSETYFSNLVLLQGFSAKIVVNVRINFRSIDGVLAIDQLNAAMIAHYL